MAQFWRRVTDYFHRSDKLLWLISFAISGFSLVILASVSRSLSGNYFQTQLMAILLGYAAAWLLTLIDYREIARFWYIIGGFCIFAILLTYLFGISASGAGGVNAKAWIPLPGGLTFQPSELAKIGFIITFAKHLSILKKHALIDHPLHVVLLGCHALVPMLLTHFQGDDGAAVIFFCMFLIMSFAAGVKLRYFAILLVLAAAAIPVLWNFVLSPYQKDRFLIFLNPESDPLGAGLQQVQGKISIASGQIVGQGLFQGPRVERESVPLQHSDFIFSVVGEELGFLGCSLVILLLFALLLRTVFVARKSCDELGSFMCFGFFAMIASQAIFNLGMCLNLLPVMGVTLPFFSAGGSSAACLYLGLGLVANVYMHRNDGDQVKINVHQYATTIS